MRDAERRVRLLDALRDEGRAAVPALASSLGVTQSTIRRDLDRLAREGRVVRTYGGAALAESLASARTPQADPRQAAKLAIAREAARLVPDHATVAIGSGTTALAVARALADRPLTVITNALDVANALLDREGIELIILGGVVRPRMHSMLGHLAELATHELRADVLVMGIGAVNPDQGLMNDSVPEILTDRALRRMARQAIVVADASKFDQVAPGFVFGLEEVDVLVTDDAIRPETVLALTKRGVRVVVATEATPGPPATTVTANPRETAR